MRHPFDGILRPDSEQTEASSEFIQSAAADAELCESRRDALKHFVAGGALAFGLTEAALHADDKQPPARSGRKRLRGGYARYLVMPRDFRGLKTDRRVQLGIGGGYFRCVLRKDETFPRAGFLAWLTDAEAKKLAKSKDVRGVLPITPADVPGPGKKPAGASQFAVQLVPNGFAKVKPPRDSFVDTPTLIDEWTKAFPDVKFEPSGSPGRVLVKIGPAGMPESLPAALKKHPQVVGVHWHGTVTTLALGEEGATTKALGEEGASTRRRGEEGGVSTRRLGEEGGRPPVTRARNEAGKPPGGGVTTLALSEEGAKGR
jgi:hypothetical protein